MDQRIFGPAVVSAEHFTGLPLSGPITATFGSTTIPEHARGHTGLDIAAPVGTEVLAPASGAVLEATRSEGVFGAYVTVGHLDGLISLYAHLSRIDVATGQRVRAGDRLGLVGMTGLTTGPHLHWGLASGAAPTTAGPHLRDPLAFIAAAPERFDRERLFRAVAFGILGALQAAGAMLDTHERADFDAYSEGSPERDILAIQLAANSLIARYTQPPP